MEAADSGGKGVSFSNPGKVDGYYKKRQEWNRKKLFSPAKSKISGLMEDMKGQIYDVGNGSKSDQFVTTTKSTARYAGRKCTDPQDIRISINNLYNVTFIITENK